MAGFLRYVSVQMVIADDGGGASLGRFCSSTQFRGGAPSNFSGYRNGYTGVPVIRPQFYTGVYVSLLIHPQFYRNGYSGGNHQEDSGGGNHQEDSGEETETELGQEILDVKFECRSEMKSEISVQGDPALKKFRNFLENITQFLESLEKFLIISMHVLACLNEIFGDGTKANLEKNGTQMSASGDSYHCYHYYYFYYYNRGHPVSLVTLYPECYPCIRFQRSFFIEHPTVRWEEVVKKCCEWCTLCNPRRAETKKAAPGDSYHCYYYYYKYYNYNNGIPLNHMSGRPECPCIEYRRYAPYGGLLDPVRRKELVQKCRECYKLCKNKR
ncbi:uncharacterized protein LOC116007264 [Ipomoea triloba]|uniref:uncharacterized protein LOC116007264 n=1 Tax=Ipomoea triloba TaxID=35885 RepID=UPI00125E5A33|nr:uncharacterized protein LOC116007264 [Ipomoea triloba]